MSSSEKVLILAPMTSELRPVVRKLRARKTSINGSTVHEARASGKMLYAGRLGVGPDRAREATERLIDAVSPDRVVLSGIAGGIDLSLPVNALVLPEVVVDLADRREVRPAPMPPEVRALFPNAASVRLATTARLIVDHRLDGLRDEGFGAIDMETSAVGKVCEERSVPWWAFRALSDRPDDDLVDDQIMKLLNEDGSPNAMAALRLVARHPSRVPKLIKLARDEASSTSLAASSAIAAIAAA